MSKYRRIPLEQLVVDPRYQRAEDEKWITHIAENFDESLLGVLEVGHRDRNGHYAIIDGQQRYRALSLLGLPDAPCLVHSNSTAKKEALQFVRLQRQRKSIHPVDRFRAELFAGDPVVKAIDKAVREADCEIGRRGDAGSARVVVAVEALRRIEKRESADAIRETLRRILSLWDGDSKSLDGALIEGVHQLFADYEDRIGEQELDRLREVPPVTILRRAAGRSTVVGGHPGSKRHVVAAELHKIAGLRGRSKS